MPLRPLLLVASLAALAGCTTARQSALPGGGTGYAIGCSGIQHTMDDCFARAADVCRSGYDIVAGTMESTPFVNPYGRSLYVRCRY